MKKFAAYLFIAFSLNQVAFANDVVVCDPSNPQVANAVTRFERQVDFPPTPGYLVWVAPNNSMSQAQQTAMNTLRAQIDSLLGVPTRYWLCTDTNPTDGVLDGLAEMSAGQKSAVDAPAAAEAARQAAFASEVSGNDLCEAELADIVSRVETRRTTLRTAVENQRITNNTTISSAANTVAGVKSAMTTINNATAAEFNQTVDELASLATKIAKCVRGRAR